MFNSGKLQKKFSNLKMVDTVSAIKIDEKALKDEGIDLIISTVEMETSIRSVVVSPLLNLEDVAKIRHVLRKLAKDKVFKRDIRAFKEKQGNKNQNNQKEQLEKDEVMNFMIMSGNIVEFFKSIEVHEDVDCDDLEELINYSSFIFDNKNKS